MIRKLSAVLLCVGMSACGTGESSVPSIDTGCVAIGRYLMQYNLAALDDTGDFLATPRMADYLQPDGTLLPFDQAVNVNNPGGNRFTGRVQLGSVFTSYLNSRGVPVDAYEDAFEAAAKRTENEPLHAADLHYLLATQLGIPDFPPAAFENGNGGWRPLEAVLGNDPDKARAQIEKTIGPALAAQRVPVDAFVDAYNKQVESCQPQ